MRASVIDQVFVNLVGDGDRIPTLAQFGDEGQFVAREHLAGWVVGSVEDDGLRVGVECGSEMVSVEMPVAVCGVRRMQCYEPWRGVRQNRVRPIVLIEGFEDDDLIARVDDGEQRRDHRLGGAAGHGDLSFGIDRQPRKPRDFRGDGVAQVLRAPGDAVLIHATANGGDGGLEHGRRRVVIGEALRQVDGLVLQGEPSHLADDRFGELLGTRGNEVAHHCPPRTRYTPTTNMASTIRYTANGSKLWRCKKRIKRSMARYPNTAEVSTPASSGSPTPAAVSSPK